VIAARNHRSLIAGTGPRPPRGGGDRIAVSSHPCRREKEWIHGDPCTHPIVEAPVAGEL